MSLLWPRMDLVPVRGPLWSSVWSLPKPQVLVGLRATTSAAGGKGAPSTRGAGIRALWVALPDLCPHPACGEGHHLTSCPSHARDILKRRWPWPSFPTVHVRQGLIFIPPTVPTPKCLKADAAPPPLPDCVRGDGWGEGGHPHLWPLCVHIRMCAGVGAGMGVCRRCLRQCHGPGFVGLYLLTCGHRAGRSADSQNGGRFPNHITACHWVLVCLVTKAS